MARRDYRLLLSDNWCLGKIYQKKLSLRNVNQTKSETTLMITCSLDWPTWHRISMSKKLSSGRGVVSLAATDSRWSMTCWLLRPGSWGREALCSSIRRLCIPAMLSISSSSTPQLSGEWEKEQCSEIQVHGLLPVDEVRNTVRLLSYSQSRRILLCLYVYDIYWCSLVRCSSLIFPCSCKHIQIQCSLS